MLITAGTFTSLCLSVGSWPPARFHHPTIFVPQVGLEPTRLTTNAPKAFVATITPSGHICHYIQAFYSLLRGIVSYLARLTAIWVPEVMTLYPRLDSNQ